MTSFVPHGPCTVASGDCFHEGRCLADCRTAAKQDQAKRITELERRVLALEKVIHDLRRDAPRPTTAGEQD